MSMGTPNGPPMAGMGGMMPGYQGWGTNPATGYGEWVLNISVARGELGNALAYQPYFLNNPCTLNAR